MERLIGLPEGELFYDENACILKCTWHGYVKVETFREILLTGSKICLKTKKMHGILLDRRDLDDFSPDAKDYLRQEFLKNEGQDARPFVHKVATIPPKSLGAQAKAKLFSRILRFAFVNLPMKVFSDEEKALKWLQVSIAASNEATDQKAEAEKFGESANKSVFKLFSSKWKKGE